MKQALLLLGTVLAATAAGARDLAGYHLAFVAAAILMAVGVVASTFVNDADAAPTMAATPKHPPATPLPKAA